MASFRVHIKYCAGFYCDCRMVGPVVFSSRWLRFACMQFLLKVLRENFISILNQVFRCVSFSCSRSFASLVGGWSDETICGMDKPHENEFISIYTLYTYIFVCLCQAGTYIKKQSMKVNHLIPKRPWSTEPTVEGSWRNFRREKKKQQQQSDGNRFDKWT